MRHNGVTRSRPNGDLEAMTHLRNLIKPGGVMLLTVPVREDAIFAPLTLVYGAQRLPPLSGYILEEQAFWIKNNQNQCLV